MKKSIILFSFSIIAFTQVFAQGKPQGNYPAPVNFTSQQDHQNMMDQLHITSLRPGADGNNPKAPNAANYDEAKANPFPKLPDPLIMNNGKKVTSAKQWWDKRRPEIMEDFDREIYGRVPKHTPKVTWEVISTTKEKIANVDVITKNLIGHVDNSTYPSDTVNIQLTLTTPANSGPVPVIMQFGFIFPPGGFRPRGGRPGPPAKPGPYDNIPIAQRPAYSMPANDGGAPTEIPAGWQYQVITRGWGYAIISPNSVQADNGAGLTKGIIGLCNQGQPRKPDDWGALRAWAWGASRAMDYFETDKAVNAKEVGLEGHSRYGKATVVTMAYDQRFAIAYISSSGEGGAKLSRRNEGEIVENVAGTGEYHWMAGNFLKYAGPLQWGDMPVDAHELLAMCAPRPIFISGGQKGDGWVDSRGMFMAAAAAGPVYKLLGKKPMELSEYPPVETLVKGDITYRQHSQGHTDVPNWPFFITFAGEYFK